MPYSIEPPNITINHAKNPPGGKAGTTVLGNDWG